MLFLHKLRIYTSTMLIFASILLRFALDEDAVANLYIIGFIILFCVAP